jgi:hypothetical protein
MRVSGPIRRQQTKWVVFGFTVTIVVMVGLMLVGVTLSFTQPGDSGVLYSMVNKTVLYLAYLLVPLSIGIAILRYRLWDLDLIIRRSLVIAPLLTILTVVFELATQLLLPFIFQFIPALEDSSSINTVVSVLIVVVLFKPLHARLDADANRIVDWHVGADRPEPLRRRISRDARCRSLALPVLLWLWPSIAESRPSFRHFFGST